MPRFETSRLASWLRDKAGRAPEYSWYNVMNECADRLEEQQRIIGQHMVHDYCWARSRADLEEVLSSLDANEYELVSVSVMDNGSFMVFFRRPAP